MRLFRLSSNNRIEVQYSAKAQPHKPGQHFSSEQQLFRIATQFPASRLVEIWNGLPGVSPVRRFTSREIAVGRIWKALQNLQSNATKAANRPNGPYSVPVRRGRAAQVIALLEAEGGASLDRLSQVTGWQKHSLRGLLSRTIRREMGVNVVSLRDTNGTRVYRIISC